MAALDLQYPLGRFVPLTSALSAAERLTMMAQLEAAPAQLRAAVSELE